MSNKQLQIEQLEYGFQTAYIDRNTTSNVAHKPQFIFNDKALGIKVLTAIEDELKICSEFMISVAFITQGGITPLLMTLKELEKKGIPGRILTTDYLVFSEPAALEKLDQFTNIELKMYCVEEVQNTNGFHTKGYLFREEEMYRFIIGSSNMTLNALTVNQEWNTKIVALSDGEYV